MKEAIILFLRFLGLFIGFFGLLICYFSNKKPLGFIMIIIGAMMLVLSFTEEKK